MKSIMKTPMAFGAKKNLIPMAKKSIMNTPLAIGGKVNVMQMAMTMANTTRVLSEIA